MRKHSTYNKKLGMARYTARYLDGYPVGYPIQYPALAAMPDIQAKMMNGLALNNSVLKYIQKSTFLIIWKYLRVISILIQITKLCICRNYLNFI